MLVIKDLQRILVLFRRRCALPLVPSNQVLKFLWEPAQILKHALGPKRFRRGGVCDNETTKPLGVARGDIICSKHTTPRLSQQIEMAFDPKLPQEVIELVHEELDCPERLWLVWKMGGCADADLVVKDDGDGMGGVDLGVGDHVDVGHAWSAVKHDEGCHAGLEVADDFVPCFVGFVADFEVDRACRFGHC